MTRFFATLKKEKLYQYENTFGVDAVETLPDSLKIFRKRISTTQLGMDLYEKFKYNVFNLSYTTILEKLDALSSGESRQIQKCFDKQQTGIKLHE